MGEEIAGAGEVSLGAGGFGRGGCDLGVESAGLQGEAVVFHPANHLALADRVAFLDTQTDKHAGDPRAGLGHVASRERRRDRFQVGDGLGLDGQAARGRRGLRGGDDGLGVPAGAQQQGRP